MNTMNKEIHGMRGKKGLNNLKTPSQLWVFNDKKYNGSDKTLLDGLLAIDLFIYLFLTE